MVVAGYEVDAFWPDAGLVVEVDSYGYHHTRRDRAKDAERDAVLRLAGLELLRVSDEMLERRPAEAARRVRAMRERGLAARSSRRQRGRSLSSQGWHISPTVATERPGPDRGRSLSSQG